MNHTTILQKILDIYHACRVTSFPLDCFSILDALNITCIKYSSLTPLKKKNAALISDDAFTLSNIIYYNDKAKPYNRIRFSLMHELGHIILNHAKAPSEKEEQQANFFASHLLAPRLVIHYSGCQSQSDVSQQFLISAEAATYAYQDYLSRRRLYAYRTVSVDKMIYEHFYSLKEENCSWNSHASDRTFPYFDDGLSEDFLAAEQSWLYGNLY